MVSQGGGEGIRRGPDQLGDCYYHGDGVLQDHGRPWSGIARRRNKDTPRRKTALGDCYAKGEGVPQDHAEAVAWYRKAAEQGTRAAQSELGDLLRQRRGRPAGLHPRR